MRALCLILLTASGMYAAPIDLTRRDFFVRQGFDPNWTRSLGDEEPGWLRIPGSAQSKSYKARDLSFETRGHRRFLSFQNPTPSSFTYNTSFQISERELETRAVRVLYFAMIGVNWEVFVNGISLRREIDLDQNGNILTSRTMRGVEVPIDSRILKKGINVISIHIIGDPSFEDTGFYRSKPYLVGTVTEISYARSESVLLILVSLYGFVGIFHLLFFFRRNKETFNLYFGCMSIALFVYYLHRTNLIFDFYADTAAVFKIDNAAAILVAPFAASFLDTLFHFRLSSFTRAYWFFCIALIAFATPSSQAFARDVLYIWQGTMPLALGYMIYLISRELGSKIWEYKSMYGMSEGRAFFRALLRTPAGNLLFGAIVVSVCVLLEMIDSVTEARGTTPTVYGLFFFVSGVAAVLTNRILEVHRKVEVLNLNLSDRIQEVEIAHEKVRTSEGKYRQLIDGSVEIILTLRSNLTVSSANRSLIKHLGMEPDELIGKSFFDLLYQGEVESGITMELIQEKVKALASSTGTVNMKLALKSRHSIEPREFNTRIERVNLDEHRQVLIKAMPAAEDGLLKYFVKENQKYVIGNFLTSAEELSQRIIRNVEKYLDSQRVMAIRIGLREILINAIEHGNLAITYDEKTRELSSGNYREFIQERQADSKFRDRKVVVEYVLSTTSVQYTITDDGAGFDYKKILAREKDAMLSTDSHGRGIVVTTSAFDRVEYNDAGNSVRLIKYFRSDSKKL